MEIRNKDNLVKSISYSQFEIINWIIKLYCPKGIQVDCTYSLGGFYKKGLVKEPEYKFDINPQIEGVQKADCRHLPLEDNSVYSIMYDPPFLYGKERNDNVGIIKRRYSQVYCWNDIKSLYRESLQEFSRILQPDGTLIFKCQDFAKDGKQHLTHSMIQNMGIQYGLYPIDLFVMLVKSRPIRYDIPQHHARKFHSYFLVFKKRKPKVNYE